MKPCNPKDWHLSIFMVYLSRALKTCWHSFTYIWLAPIYIPLGQLLCILTTLCKSSTPLLLIFKFSSIQCLLALLYANYCVNTEDSKANCYVSLDHTLRICFSGWKSYVNNFSVSWCSTIMFICQGCFWTTSIHNSSIKSRQPIVHFLNFPSQIPTNVFLLSPK